MEERVRKLERRCRMQSLLMCAFALVLPVLLFSGADFRKDPPENVAVRSLTIVDEDGKPRIKLSAEGGTADFEMFRPSGDLGYSLLCSKGLFEQAVFDTKKQVRFSLSAHEIDNSAHMSISDTEGASRFSVHSRGNNDFSMSLIKMKGEAPVIRDLYQDNDRWSQ